MTVQGERLSAALSDRYRIERERGQGGTSRFIVVSPVGATPEWL